MLHLLSTLLFLVCPLSASAAGAPRRGGRKAQVKKWPGAQPGGLFAVTAAQEPAAGPAALPWAHLLSASGLGALAVPSGPSSAAGRTERSCSWVRAT